MQSAAFRIIECARIDLMNLLNRTLTMKVYPDLICVILNNNDEALCFALPRTKLSENYRQ